MKKKKEKNECQHNARTFCNGKLVRWVQLRTAVNVYDGKVIKMCAGCRTVMQGSFKYFT